MKLRAADLRRSLARPATVPRGLLLFGEDAARVVMLRDEAIAALGGPQAEADMRVLRLMAQEARSHPDSIANGLTQMGFFPGVRIVVVADATDGLAAALLDAVRAAAPGEAYLVVTAGILPARSALRKGFETEAGLAAVACYAESVDAGEIAAALRCMDVPEVEPAALEALARLSAEMDRLSLQQLLAKLALYHGGAGDALSLEAVSACAPPGEGAELDDLAVALLARAPDTVMAMMSRLSASGSGGVAMAIVLGRFFRQMLEARLVMDSLRLSADAALGRVQPPLRLPTRRAAACHLGTWRVTELERACLAVQGLDASLRSELPLPASALVERILLRLAIAGRP